MTYYYSMFTAYIYMYVKPCTSPSSLSFSYISKPPYQQKFYSMASIASKELAANTPGLHTSPDETNKGYLVLQTMFQIKDPKISLDFYSRILGMLLKRVAVPELKFTLYFMSYEDVSLDSSDPVDRTVNHHSYALHNWDTESDQEFKGYQTRNSEPLDSGHIGITLDDTIKACERFQRLGVEFSKKQL
ncbi:hypothetical protein V6Z12_D03G163800 [Gossypium hirsutum]